MIMEGEEVPSRMEMEESLAVSKEDSPEVVHNITISWSDCVDTNKESYSKAMISVMALSSLFIVLILKANKYVRKVIEVKLA